MFHFVGSVALAYLAGTGMVTAAAVMGKGMVRAVRKAIANDLRDAGVEALAALAVPAVLSYTAGSSLIGEVGNGASELAGNALDGATVEHPSRDPAYRPATVAKESALLPRPARRLLPRAGHCSASLPFSLAIIATQGQSATPRNL